MRHEGRKKRSDPHGFHAAGNLVQTIYPSGVDDLGNPTPLAIERTIYDVNNRPLLKTAPHSPALGDAYPYLGSTTTFGTAFEYDALGRTLKTMKVIGIASELRSAQGATGLPIPGVFTSQKVAGSLAVAITTTQTEYDEFGRVTKVVQLASPPEPSTYRRFEYQLPAATTLGMSREYVGTVGGSERLISETDTGPDGRVIAERTGFSAPSVWSNKREYTHDAEGRVSRITLNASGRIKLTHPGSKQTDPSPSERI